MPDYCGDGVRKKDASASWAEWRSLFHLCEDINIFTHQGTLQQGYMEGKEMIISERLNGLIIWFSATSSCLDPPRCFMRQQRKIFRVQLLFPPPPYFLCSLSLSCMLNAANRSLGKNASRVISTGELITHVAYLSSLWHLWLFNVIYYQTKYWKRANSRIICDPLTHPHTHVWNRRWLCNLSVAQMVSQAICPWPRATS